MAATELAVALSLIIIALAIWVVRQHGEAARHVPLVAGPCGVLAPAACGLIACYLLASPVSRSGLLSASAVFGASPVATQTATALLSSAPTPPSVWMTPMPVPTPEFVPYWVRNHLRTQMWSGRAGQPGVISFGRTSGQFCVFKVMRPQDNSRLYVLNPYDKNYFWIDANAIGPVREPPEHRAGARPTGENCTDAIFDE